MRALAVVTAAGAMLLCAACGGGRPTPEPTWRANAAGLLAQLRADVAATGLGGQSRLEAAHALASPSTEYALLVAYADLAGCAAMAKATAAPPRIVRALSAPCPSLQRAAALFTRAETTTDPGALLAAARVAQRAQAQLVRAALALRR